MASAGTVSVDFAAETAKFTAELKKVNEKLNEMSSSFKFLEGSAAKLFEGISVAAVGAFAKHAISAALALDDMAERAGIATSSFSKLAFAAEQSDLSVDSLAKGIKDFQKSLSEANSGNKDAAAAFRAIGVSVDDLKAAKPEDQLALIAEGFSKNVAPIDRTRVAIDLFKKSGNEFIPLLLKGADGVKALTDATSGLDDHAVKALDRAGNAINRFFTTIKNSIANGVGGLVADIFGSGSEIIDLEAKVRNLTQLKAALIQGNGGEVNAALQFQLDNYNSQLSALDAQLDRLKRIQASQQAALNPKFASNHQNIGPDLLGGEITLTQQRMRVLGSPENFAELFQEFEDKARESIDQTILKGGQDLSVKLSDVRFTHEEDLTARLAEEENKRLEHEREVREFSLREHGEFIDAKLALEQGAVNASIGLLRLFAGKNKAAAIALIAVQKGIAIAQAIMNTSVAVTKALADPTLISTGLNIAAAAHIRLIGAVEVAAIAATGFAEAGSVGAGGASLGSSANPVFTSSADTSFSSDSRATAQPQKAIQIIIPGNIYAFDDFKKTVIDALKEADQSDTVIFTVNGAQAQTIRAT